MDGKGRLGVRNWDFSGHHHVKLEPALKTLPEVTASQTAISHHQASYLRMSGYHQEQGMVAEPGMASLDFTWDAQRNFLSAPKSSSGIRQQTPVEIPGMQGFPASTNDDLHDNQIDNKPKKSRKRTPSEKKAAQTSSGILKAEKQRKQPSGSGKKKGASPSTGTREKKNLNIVYEGINFDFSGVPAPVCSCTGVPRQCYRWGAGGWQSSCCTTTISVHPLPMSPSRPGARVAGRKMSIGAYMKLLQRLAADGQDLSHAVDLKNHWARHGTNKFVTIR